MKSNKTGFIPLNGINIGVASTNGFPGYFEKLILEMAINFDRGYSPYHLMAQMDVAAFTPVYTADSSYFLSRFSLLRLSELEKFLDLFPGVVAVNNLKEKEFFLDDKFIRSNNSELSIDDKVPLASIKPEFIYRGIYKLNDPSYFEEIVKADKSMILFKEIGNSSFAIVDSYVGFDRDAYFSQVKSIR